MEASADIAELRARARSVLEGNWLGRSTKPAPDLYPHQWSWDSAFIAIGYATGSWERGVSELTTLFEGQWSTGLVPHIVFGAGDGVYWPSPDFWASRSCAAAPRTVDTSGICQPPVHAWAARRLFEARPDEAGREFLRSVYEPLTAWHDYLHRDRAVGSPLVEIWHPWESGMDNSPAWDSAMAALRPRAEEIPEYRRVDTDLVDASERPTDEHYDRYAFLVERLRRDGYSPASPEDHPFRIRDVLFNSLLVTADRDLAWIADRLGARGSGARERAGALATEMHRLLWNEDLGMHVSFDAAHGIQIPYRIAGGFGALLADPPPALAARAVQTLESQFLVPTGDRGAVLPTVAPSDPAFTPTGYWRGPAWVQVMWTVAAGLDAVGSDALAASLRRGIISLVSTAGFAEYFDPHTREGHGSDRFSWTAALFLDLTAGLRTD